jgi:5-methylcytosine-specific restriction endonuclease McrA
MKMKESILRLRKQGKTYNEIKSLLGCSKSTISYYCGEGQKEKSKNRLSKNRKFLVESIRLKIDRFVRSKVRNFKRGDCTDLTTGRAGYDSFYKKISEISVCYLTGRKIDLTKRQTYSLDHIIPITRDGKNTLDNCGVSCREANQAKHNLLVTEFIQLCIDVCKHNGYSVIEKTNAEVAE